MRQLGEQGGETFQAFCERNSRSGSSGRKRERMVYRLRVSRSRRRSNVSSTAPGSVLSYGPAKACRRGRNYIPPHLHRSGVLRGTGRCAAADLVPDQRPQAPAHPLLPLADAEPGPAAVKEWAPSLLNEFKRAVPIMLQRPGILFNLRRGGPAAPPDKPPGEVPLPFRNFFLEYAPESYAFEYDESRMRRGFWCYWMDGNSFLLQSFGTSEKRPVGMEISAYEWRPEGGLACKSEPELMGTYVTAPLDLIQMTVDGLLRLVPPGNLGHGYMELTTTEKFWPARREWTYLLEKPPAQLGPPV